MCQGPTRRKLSSWSATDIGTVGLAGSATYANGVFTVKGAGDGTFSVASDEIHFAYQPLAGDGTIVARVVTLQGAAAAQAGVMIRESLAGGSKHAFMFFYQSGAWQTTRTSTDASSSYQSFAGSVTLPYWVKVQRTGDTLTTSRSVDGVNWLSGTSQTISMAQNVYIGLAGSSRNTATLATATFDSVSISSAATAAPVITSASATTGSVTEPSSSDITSCRCVLRIFRVSHCMLIATCALKCLSWINSLRASTPSLLRQHRCFSFSFALSR